MLLRARIAAGAYSGELTEMTFDWQTRAGPIKYVLDGPGCHTDGALLSDMYPHQARPTSSCDTKSTFDFMDDVAFADVGSTAARRYRCSE